MASPTGFEPDSPVASDREGPKQAADDGRSRPSGSSPDHVTATGGQNEPTDQELQEAAIRALSEGRLDEAHAATAELSRRAMLRALKPKPAHLRRVK